MQWGERWSCHWGRESNWRSKETRRRTESWWVCSCCFQASSPLQWCTILSFCPTFLCSRTVQQQTHERPSFLTRSHRLLEIVWASLQISFVTHFSFKDQTVWVQSLYWGVLRCRIVMYCDSQLSAKLCWTCTVKMMLNLLWAVPVCSLGFPDSCPQGPVSHTEMEFHKEEDFDTCLSYRVVNLHVWAGWCRWSCCVVQQVKVHHQNPVQLTSNSVCLTP